MFYSRVHYKFFDNDTGKELVLEEPFSADPINWDNSEKMLKRSTKTFGIMTELSKDLEFVKEAKIFLDTSYLINGIEADVTMEEWRAYPNKDGYYLHSTGHFDFSERKWDKIKTKIPFKTGGLNTQIQAQLKEKFELDRTESIKGDVIDALNTIDFNLSARNILRISRLETTDYDNDSVSYAFRMAFNDGNHRTGSLGIPVEIKINSDEFIQNVIIDQSFTTNPNKGEVLSVFYLNNDEEKTLRLKIKMRAVVKDYIINDLSNAWLSVRLVKFGDGNNLNIISAETLQNIPFPLHNRVINFTYKDDLKLLAGESLSLQWYGGGNFGNWRHRGELKVNFENIKATIDIEEDSTFGATPTKGVLFHDVGEKLLQIITGKKNRFYSSLFGRKDLGYTNTGDYALVTFTIGFWLRQFFEKKFQFSLDQFLVTANAIFNTGYGIETINDAETLVVEDLKYFFQDKKGIVLPSQVSNVKREVAKEFYHSTLEFGYKKPDGDNLYEEAMGLDEYNGKRGYTNNITKDDKKYKKLSEARADRYGAEFARRKPKNNFPETDTRYDSNAFLLDLKHPLGQQYTERLWRSDYEIKPTEVYSYETASNLRLTPFRCLERHGWFFSAGLQKYPDQKIRFSNSNLNSSLVTKKAGEVARAENGDILISDLEAPRFLPEWISFDYPVNYDVNQMVYGKKNINGRLIPNYYFLVEFINEFSQKEYGYLFELKPNKEGKWKLLKANI